MFNFILLISRTHTNRHCTDPYDGVIYRYPLRAVWQIECHPVSRNNADLIQIAREVINQGVELRVSIAFVLVDKRVFVIEIAGTMGYYFR